MQQKDLLSAFLSIKNILCRYDYFIYTSKRVFRITNTEDRIPHLMGLQYIGPKGAYTGDNGAYLIKKKKLKYSSLERLVRKFYKKQTNRIRSYLWSMVRLIICANWNRFFQAKLQYIYMKAESRLGIGDRLSYCMRTGKDSCSIGNRGCR